MDEIKKLLAHTNSRMRVEREKHTLRGGEGLKRFAAKPQDRHGRGCKDTHHSMARAGQAPYGWP